MTTSPCIGQPIFLRFTQLTVPWKARWSTHRRNEQIFRRKILINPWSQGLAVSVRKFCIVKNIGDREKADVNYTVRQKQERKGTIAGAVALIVGTSIGSGILALPQRTSSSGLIPSEISLVLCWGFLVIEALLLAEINVKLRRRIRRTKRIEGDLVDMEIISISTMAEETLGKWGGIVAGISYTFLGYTSLVAYAAKSGEILSHFINIPTSISGISFMILFSFLIWVGGKNLTDQVNQWLTASMIGLLMAIEVIAASLGHWNDGTMETINWGNVPGTVPVLIFSLVYHDIAPVICAYLHNDINRIRKSIILGSLVPLLALLLWEAIAFSLSPTNIDGIDPVEMLLRVKWTGVPVMVQTFSLLAVGTSIIGTLLGFSEFFLEQLNSLGQDDYEDTIDATESDGLGKWWRNQGLNLTTTAMVVAPPMVVLTSVPDAFSVATDIAGGYCMTMLYGVLPPAMAWAMNVKSGAEKGGEKTKFGSTDIKLAILGLLACGIITEEIIQDLSFFHTP